MTLNELGFKQVNVITIKQYAYGNSDNIIIQHETSTKDTKGTWSYFGGSIWDNPPKFKELNDLIEYIENKRKKY